MNATQTAIDVINWTMSGTGSPPWGHLSATLALGKPSKALRVAMQTLTAQTSAKMYWGAPPLHDERPLGVGGAILAAAIGGLHTPNYARQMIPAIPPAANPAEWLLRHALVTRILPFLTQTAPLADLKADFFAVSPLTALINTPPPSQQNTLMSLVEQLFERLASRRWLQLSLAQPTDNQAIRDWHQNILAQLRQTEQDQKTTFVLDVYETLMIHHRPAAFKQVRSARRVLRDENASKDEQRLQEALSIAQWWQPLWALRRTRKDEIRQRLYLDYQYLEGLELYTLAQRLRTRVM